MQRAGNTANGATTRRRRRELGRGIAIVSCVAVAAVLALAFSYGYDPIDDRDDSPNSLAIPSAAADGGDADPASTGISTASAFVAVEPAASASAPDGAPTIAASLVASATAAPYTVTLPPPTESPGKTAANDPPAAPAVQLAALVPMRPTGREPPPAVSPATPAPAAKAPSGPLPWRAYARPFDRADTRPHLAIVVAGTDDNMDRAIESLPPAVTLALDPYARRLPEWIELARAKGHEVLLTLSMPAIDRGRRDAGPMAILASLDPKENLERLDWALGRTTGFVGVLDLVAGRPASENRAVLTRLKHDGLMLVSAAAASGPDLPPLALGDALLTPDMPRRERQEQLDALEVRLRRDGHALAIEIVTPENLAPLSLWLARLKEQSVVLAPASALVAAAPAGAPP